MIIRAIVRVVLYSLVCFLVACTKPVSDQTIVHVESSVVHISCYDENRMGYGSGTGFFVNRDGYFVFPRHVRDSDERKNTIAHTCQLAVDLSQQNWQGHKYLPRAVNCVTDQTHDISACQLRLNPFQHPESFTISVATLQTQTQTNGVAVAYVGFPINTLAPVADKGTVSGYYDGAVNYTNSRMDAWPYQLPVPGPYLNAQCVDCPDIEGFSGGPVFLANGEVIGMVVAAGKHEISAVPASVIADFLRRNSIATNQ